MLQSDLCDYSNAYIVAEGTITVARPNNTAYDKKLTFKSNTEDLDIVMPVYNLIE